MASNERKILKTTEKEVEVLDNLSNLPDEILSEILSFLPTKEAIRTSILSNRWKNIWTSINSFHFESDISVLGSDLRAFTNFVNNAFHRCNSSQMRKLFLHSCDFFTEKIINAWIDEAIKRKVTELDIFVYTLPISIFTCTSLTSLSFGYHNHHFYHSDFTSFNLPSLKVLHIKGRNNHLNEFAEKLIASCPVIQDLTLTGSFEYKSGRNFTVSAPTLTSLSLQFDKAVSRSYCVWGPFSHTISVEAPNLKYLHLSETFIKYDIKGDLSSVVKAYVNIKDNFTTPTGRPFHLQKNAIPFALPKFYNLKCLEVVTCDYRFWAMLPKFFRSSPSLEVLSLEQLENDTLPDEEYTWVEPKSKCLASKLRVIEVEGMKGKYHELHYLKYCLGNAKALQRLAINCRGLTQVSYIKFYEQIRKFPIASKCCKIQFGEAQAFKLLNFF